MTNAWSGVLGQQPGFFCDAFAQHRVVRRFLYVHLEAARHHLVERAVQRLARGRELLRDRIAGQFLLHHCEHAADLALDAPEPVHDLLLMRTVGGHAGLGDGRGLGARAALLGYIPHGVSSMHVEQVAQRRKPRAMTEV